MSDKPHDARGTVGPVVRTPLCEWCGSAIRRTTGILRGNDGNKAVGWCDNCRAVVWSKPFIASPNGGLTGTAAQREETRHD
jgi:hypothetical protein